MKLSAKNQLKGKIRSLTTGAVNSEIVIELPGGDIVTSIIKASNVIVGID